MGNGASINQAIEKVKEFLPESAYLELKRVAGVEKTGKGKKHSAKWDKVYRAILAETGDSDKAAAIATAQVGKEENSAKGDRHAVVIGMKSVSGGRTVYRLGGYDLENTKVHKEYGGRQYADLGFSLPTTLTVKKGAEVEILRNAAGQLEIQPPTVELSREVKIIKADNSRRLVTGVVLSPYYFDSQGDIVPVSEISEAAHSYMSASRVMKYRHSEEPLDCEPVESYCFPYPTPADEEAARAGLEHTIYKMQVGGDWIRSGEWVMTAHVTDDRAWGEVEKGEINAFSVGGFGKREPADGQIELPKVKREIIINADAA